MKIGVVADTHSEPNAKGLEVLAGLRPDVILHAGDIGDLAVLKRLEQIAPLHAVRGNIDDASSGLPEARVLELGPLRLYLTHIAVYGPRIRADVAKKARAANTNLIICGHSHVPFIAVERGLTVFNPGSIGPRRPGLPIVFGVADLGADGLHLEHVDCETGKRWLPPPL